MPHIRVCPACRSGVLRVLPTSRTTGRATVSCRACGMHAHAQHDDAPAELVQVDALPPEGYDSYVNAKRDGGKPQEWRNVLESIRDLRGPGAELYDVGAGDGGFLQLARDEFGFRVAGNETSVAAVQLARQKYGVGLELGDLAALGHENEYDAVTMWCVLAHVPDSDQLLADALRLLRPGGLLYAQTPRLTAPDRMAVAALRATRGRVTKIVDRRLPVHHGILHTADSIATQLRRLGYVEVQAVARARYTLNSDLYARFLGARGPLVRPASAVLDLCVRTGVAPRIVLDVSARKPT